MTTPRVMIHPATHENIRLAVDQAFAVFPQECRGKKVLIKPNALRAADPSEGIATHPALVRAVVEMVEAMSPSSLIVGDNPGVAEYGANERCFKKTGLMDAAKGYYQNIGNDSEKVDFRPDLMPVVSVSRAVMEADIVISLPKFKTHGLTVVSGAIKNSFGLLPGAQKGRIHRAAGSADRFHEVLVDVFRLRVPDLFIVDAVVGMEGNGPASPDIRDIGLLLASDNGVALDAVIATMMGCDPGHLRFLRRAKELGLGDYDLDRIEILGALVRLPDFKLPPLSGAAILADDEREGFLDSRILLRPRVDSGSCTTCGTCVDHCPVSALSMEYHLPVADATACIACFCCQEVCPEKAIVLQ